MATTTCLLEALPNEILAASLAYLSTRELIHIVPISRVFYILATRLIHRRLIDVSPLPHNQLILECYHPSARLSTPTLSCRYLGLKTASEQPIRDESLRFTDLGKLYSSFRPVSTDENRIRRSSSQTVSHASQGDSTATQEVYIDEDVLFSQLVTVTSVVKESSKSGFFVSHVTTCDGFIRIWRQWLADMASSNDDEKSSSTTVDFDKFLWVGPGRDVGLRFRVELGPAERMPLLSGPGDDAPVAYTLIYEELIVRTSTLLMAAEASMVQESSRSSRAVIIAQV
ncbi:F-box domain-containing protein [Pochonia chlamydosporia 170]|uniref:F-box domain-containing protein n=1 Tax=Pochonia chlamydosporia 170 TaxID=1380566 RepID=A0A179FUY3_METCM|nr:F-box domain-containing protein [Pochonia chlamydosporia 170]OAQ68883.1 F-box domain-containing protein [Pochonia chlamydosporia 170]